MNTTNEMVMKILALDCCEFCGFCKCTRWASDTKETNEVVTKVAKAVPNEMKTIVRTIHSAREVVMAPTSIESALRMAA